MRSTLPADGAGGAEDGRRGYATVWYPGSLTTGGARSVQLAAGQERSGLDLQLEILSLSYIEGVVTGIPDGARAQITLVDLSDTLRAATYPSVQATADGYFRLVNVPPGSYQLVALTVTPPLRSAAPGPTPPAFGQLQPEPAHTLWGTSDVAVSDQPLRGVSLALRPGMTVSGLVQYKATKRPALPLELTRAVARLVPADGSGTAGELAQQISALVQPDGSFRLRGVTPGKYRLVGSAEGGWLLHSAFLSGRDTLDFPIEVKAGQDLEDALITFTDRRTGLSGTVDGANTADLGPIAVVLFASDRQFWSQGTRRVLLARVSADRRFALPDVPPGEYRVAAFKPGDSDDLLRSGLLESLEQHSIAVTLVEGEQLVMAVPFWSAR